jgi:hypothetical protein
MGMSSDAVLLCLRGHVQMTLEMTTEMLREEILDHLVRYGFVLAEDGTLRLPQTDKANLRRLHEPARQMELATRQEWLRDNLSRYLRYFASGHEVIPERIKPRLLEVGVERGLSLSSRSQHDLFRIARLLWSIPFSKGYGRRLRFLVLDESNNKIMGLLALQSPPLSFPARDRLFQYPPGRKTELVNQTMDIQTLGAVPPYDRLLGGKLVALAAASNEVRIAYQRKYADRQTEMKKRTLPAHLVALTTTSAFGRSSIYNRLRYGSIPIAESIGYTDGYGSFHLMELYPTFRTFLESQGVSTRGGFGTGPRIKWQTMVRALERIGFSQEMLRHGVKREVFLFPLVENLKDYMEGRIAEPACRDFPFADLATHWCKRWLLPRSERVNGWNEWHRDQIVEALTLSPEEGHVDDG